MEDKLIELLSSLKYPVIRQGSLAPDEKYPDTFFTCWNNSDYDHSNYDNKTFLSEESFDVNVYSTSADTVYSLQREAQALLKQNKFIIAQRGYDIASDEITHVGRGMEVIYLKNEMEV